MKEREIEPGTPEINKKYSIVVDRKGPLLGVWSSAFKTTVYRAE